MGFLCLSLALLGVVVALLLGWLQRRYTYWARRGVAFEKPTWFRGNFIGIGKTVDIRMPFRHFYEKYKGKEQFVGFYFPMRPAALLLDLDLVKHVLIKDFNNFAHRGNYYNERDDPISAHLFNLDGPGWRDIRSKLTPTFTSQKMHLMLPIVVEIADRFVARLQRQLDTSKAVAAKETPVEMKELLARFTIDIIGSCAFGLDCNSLEEPKSEFLLYGRKTFAQRRHGAFVNGFIQAFPNLARRLHIKLQSDDVAEFYIRIVRETLDYRQKNNVQRNDFLNLLIKLGKQEDGGLSFNQIAAQAFVFFLAGFETSSSTMGFALYLLATHPEVQDKARAEVQQVFSKHAELSYEAIKELKYILQVLYETMRMYSIAPILLRRSLNDYDVPGSTQVIEAGTTIIIPVDAIHQDANIYPDPERFDPDRFDSEAVEQRHSMAWLPFGQGPRNCIGLRFGEMQSVVGLATLLKNFRFSPAKETPIPLEIDKKAFVLSSKGGIVLNVQPVSK